MKRQQTCKICGQVKSIKDFPKDKRTKSGISLVCADCLMNRTKKVRTLEKKTNPISDEELKQLNEIHDAAKEVEKKVVPQSTQNSAGRLLCPHCGGSIVISLGQVQILMGG